MTTSPLVLPSRRGVPEWHGRVSEDGARIALQHKAAYQRWLRTKANQLVTVTVAPYMKRRSLSQNSFWFGVVVPAFGERCGYLPHEYDCVHDELVRTLIGLRPDCHPDLKIRVSTRSLSTAQFSRLIEDAQIFAADKLGLIVPDPDPEYAFRRKHA